MFDFLKKTLNLRNSKDSKFKSKYTDEYIMMLHEEFKKNCLYSEEELESTKVRDEIVYKQMIQRNAAAQLVFNDTVAEIIKRRDGK